MILNLLPIAMQTTAILGCNKEFTYIEYDDTKTVINDIGNEVPAVKLQETYTGSVQAVSNKMFEQMGLDLSRNYKLVYCPQLVQSIAEKEVTGKILYDGRTWDIIENQNWFETNGFTKFIMCENKSLRVSEDSESESMSEDNSENNNNGLQNQESDI